jgi:hypothetical protein
MSGLAFVVASILLVIFLLIIFIQPVWSILDCVSTSHRSHLSKALWSLAVLITWFAGSFAYGYFAAQSPGLRRLTLFALLILALFVLACGAVILTDPDLLRVLKESGAARSVR